jgi:hypothetical protein
VKITIDTNGNPLELAHLLEALIQSLVFHQEDTAFQFHSDRSNSTLTATGTANEVAQWRAIPHLIRQAQQLSEANQVPLEDTLRALLIQQFGAEQKDVIALAHLLADRALITALTIF